MNYHETLREIDEDIRKRKEGRSVALLLIAIDLMLAVAINSTVVTSTLPTWCLAAVFVVVCIYFGNSLSDTTRYVSETPRVLADLAQERAEFIANFDADLD